jgi:hypothetical protein
MFAFFAGLKTAESRLHDRRELRVKQTYARISDQLQADL